jgi:hypothetical protein
MVDLLKSIECTHQGVRVHILSFCIYIVYTDNHYFKLGTI